LRALGITLSAVQAEIANTRAARLGLQHRALIVQGDFQAVPAAPSFAMAYSIEAFAHATHPEIYLQQAARVLTHGGRLILCDDFRAARRAWNKTERAWLDTYQSGWHIPNLQTVAQVQTRAAQVGLHLVTNRALTPHLKLRALPGRIARFVQRAGNHFPVRHPLIPSMMGSMALQQCLQSGLIEYRWLVFEKT
jgi:cyclopropane fatty-acyl-phospholipid synthase-like methyltransferase